MGALSRESILGAKDLPRKRVEVPEWGGYVYVRTLTGAERDKYEADMLTERGKGPNLANLRARLAVLAVVDEDGHQLFEPGDAGSLGAKSASALDRVFDVARELSGLSPKDVDDLAKNSDVAPSGDSSSVSPSPSVVPSVS